MFVACGYSKSIIYVGLFVRIVLTSLNRFCSKTHSKKCVFICKIIGKCDIVLIINYVNFLYVKIGAKTVVK